MFVVRPRVVTSPPNSYGEDTREIEFEGSAQNVTVFARAALVREGRDVYLLSVTSIPEPDLLELDRLLELAVQRLGY